MYDEHRITPRKKSLPFLINSTQINKFIKYKVLFKVQAAIAIHWLEKTHLMLFPSLFAFLRIKLQVLVFSLVFFRNVIPANNEERL